MGALGDGGGPFSISEGLAPARPLSGQRLLVAQGSAPDSVLDQMAPRHTLQKPQAGATVVPVWMAGAEW